MLITEAGTKKELKKQQLLGTMKLMPGISLYPLPGIHLVLTPPSKLSLSGMSSPDLQPPPSGFGSAHSSALSISLPLSGSEGKAAIARHAQCWPAETLDFVVPTASTKPGTVSINITGMKVTGEWALSM